MHLLTAVHEQCIDKEALSDICNTVVDAGWCEKFQLKFVTWTFYSDCIVVLAATGREAVDISRSLLDPVKACNSK